MWESPIYKPQVEPRWSISCGKSLFTNSTCCLEERFMWKISIYKLNCSVSCGKFLFTNSTGAFRVENIYLQTQLQRFVWEIPIYKLNWSVSCGKFLFTNSTAAFRVGNSYLQTQLERFVWEISIYKLNWSVSCGKFLFTNSTSVCVFPIYKLFSNLFTNLFTNLILKGKSIFQASDPWSGILQSNSGFYMPVPENSFFP